MEFLRKEDLPYFEKLEEEGQAVIFRLDPATLMKMDLRVLAKDPPKTNMDEEEIRSWLTEKGLIGVREENGQAERRKEEATGNSGNAGTKSEAQSVEELLLKAKLSTEKKEALIEALLQGCDKNLLYLFLRQDFTAEDIKRFLK